MCLDPAYFLLHTPDSSMVLHFSATNQTDRHTHIYIYIYIAYACFISARNYITAMTSAGQHYIDCAKPQYNAWCAIYVDQRIYTCVVRVVVWQEPHTRIVSCIVKWIYYCEHQNLVFHILYKKSKKALGVVHYFVTYFDLTRYVFDVCGAFAHFHKEGDTHTRVVCARNVIFVQLYP